MQQRTRTVEYFVCEAVTKPVTRTYTVHEEVREQKKSTRKESRMVTKPETRTYTPTSARDLAVVRPSWALRDL